MPDRRGVTAPGRIAGASVATPVRASVWVLHVAVPLLGLWLLVARPAADVMWENHPVHFWLVLSTALVNLGVAAAMNVEARRRRDARLFLVSLGFASSAGFLGLHALATPGLLFAANTGFAVATPVGLLIAALFAAWSAMSFSGAGNARILRAAPVLRGLVALALAGWLVASLAKAHPLAMASTPMEVRGPLVGLMSGGSALFLLAALRYWLLFRRRPSVVLLSVITAFVLLAEALVSVTYGRNWHASWWEWHLLMTFAFGFVAYSAVVQWGREGSSRSLFAGVALQQSVRALQHEYGAALEALVEATADGAAVAVTAQRVADRFGLTERQRDVLVRSSEALTHERDLIRRQGALVALGEHASVVSDEDELLARVRASTDAFGDDEVQVRLLGDTAMPSRGRQTLTLPITVKGKPAGSLEVARAAGPFAERDRALYASFASQLSIALENTRLYQQLDGLFRSYLSPDVASSLLADPGQADLGGAVAEVSVLMADLAGFTAFAERTAPGDVVAMLNSYFAVVVPVILDEGGTVVQFVGDAIMAIFNAPVRQVDHAARAARAALRLQQESAAVAGDDWPRFRVGVNSGPALVGNIGAEQIRVFTAIGDTTNLAARLEAHAPVGGVLVSAATLAALGADAVAEAVGSLELKGKAEPVPAYRLRSLHGVPAVGSLHGAPAVGSLPGAPAEGRDVADEDGAAFGLDPAP